MSGGAESGRSTATTDEFLSAYIDAAKKKAAAAAAPVKPDSLADHSLLVNDENRPLDWRRFYSNVEIEEIISQECADSEYRWRACTTDPPTFYERLSRCHALYTAFTNCQARMRDELRRKEGNFLPKPAPREDRDGRA
ncbi:hypothetical protein H4R18_002341 [Coemansia javaensis]|uniref:Uncharacterized protein n=1 Tax=Coemansia javaensis TaxID=2761396 RepID=A0A9W8HB28_9FUNG|nr:hypothetical protein H4R18_002341 [Coemansia javaensis]